MIIAKGQPPDDMVGIVWLWLRTPIDYATPNLTWGVIIAAVALLALLQALGRARR